MSGVNRPVLGKVKEKTEKRSGYNQLQTTFYMSFAALSRLLFTCGVFVPFSGSFATKVQIHWVKFGFAEHCGCGCAWKRDNTTVQVGNPQPTRATPLVKMATHLLGALAHNICHLHNYHVNAFY